MDTIDRDIETTARAIATEFGVCATLHSDDHILGYLLEHPQFRDRRDEAIREYFAGGQTSARRVHALIGQHLRRPLLRRLLFQPLTILDFASGYACVTRHLKHLFPRAAATACDIHPAAVAFIQQKLGINAILSTHRPDEFNIGRRFDVIFALSFFSHMPDATWGNWLNALYQHLEQRGILIMTANGLKSFPLFPPGTTLDNNGFHFLPQSEQIDLDVAEYGSTVTSPDYVRGQIAAIGAELVHFQEAGWYSHQDVYVLRR